MTDLELKQALLTYTQPAAESQSAVKRRVMANLPTHPRWAVPALAAACAALALGLFALTPPGAAAAAVLQESAAALWAHLFPPKAVTVPLEGPEEILHHPQVEEPTQAHPGFTIYVDEQTYQVVEEETGDTVIRPLPDYDPTASGLPPCQLRITHHPDLTPADALEHLRTQLETDVGATTSTTEPDHPQSLHASAGTAWDSVIADGWIVPDSRDGSFVLRADYFLEAAEGHGARLAAAAATFQVLDGPAPDS